MQGTIQEEAQTPEDLGRCSQESVREGATESELEQRVDHDLQGCGAEYEIMVRKFILGAQHQDSKAGRVG